MALGKKLKKARFRISLKKKFKQNRHKELDLFARCLRLELEERGPTPQSILYDEAREYLLAHQRGHTYLVTKLEEYFFGRSDTCPHRIKRIKLKYAVRKHINSKCTHLTIAHGQVSPLEHILYLNERSLITYLHKAYQGTEVRTYINLDFSKTT